MELHIQKCQSCGSRDLRNILVRELEQQVYVQCRQCDLLVARYKLANAGYFHAGKGFESFLRSIERDSSTLSGRDFQDWFDELEQEANDTFKRVRSILADRYGNDIP